MEKSDRKWSARITDGRTIGRKCAFVVGLHNDSVYEDCIASIELNHKEDADGWFEKYSRIADCMNTCSELQAKASAYDRLMGGGKFTMKEMANIKKRPVTIDKDGAINAHGAEPHLARGGFAGYSDCWVNDADDYEEIPESLVEIPDGFDWTTSLTLPDGWEEA